MILMIRACLAQDVEDFQVGLYLEIDLIDLDCARLIGLELMLKHAFFVFFS